MTNDNVKSVLKSSPRAEGEKKSKSHDIVAQSSIPSTHLFADNTFARS